jgi:hypothetical protein
MKLVDRKTFMEMPSGTVFFKLPMRADVEYHDPLFEGQPLMVKCDSIKDDNGEYIDFFFKSVGCGLIAGAYGDQHDALEYMQQHTGEDVRFFQVSERDGLFEGDEVGFAILSEHEIGITVGMLRGEGGDGSKMIPVHGYQMHIVCEVVYPSPDTDFFEKELLETITANACTGISRALDSGNDEERLKMEKYLCDTWMSVLGSGYRDFVNRVELSRYEHQQQTIYQAKFVSRFIYD